MDSFKPDTDTGLKTPSATCLQQDPSSKESFQLNRIIINSGSIRYHNKEQDIALNDLQFSLRRADSDGRPFDISGTLQNIGNPISWQGVGHLVQDDVGWSVPALKFKPANRIIQK